MSAPSSSPGTAGAAASAVNEKLHATLPTAVTDKIPHLPETKEEIKADAKAAASGAFAQIRSFVAGGFGGICAVVVGHPFDLVKVRLQTAERGVYSSAVDVVRKSVAKDGLRRGLYAGVSAPLVGVTPMCESVLFSASALFFAVQPCCPDLVNLADRCHRSRCLLLGLRSRKEHRRQYLHGRL